jgi:hypothetical protein
MAVPPRSTPATTSTVFVLFFDVDVAQLSRIWGERPTTSSIEISSNRLGPLIRQKKKEETSHLPGAHCSLQILMRNHIKCHSRSGGSDVHKGDGAFQSVMPGLVEQVTQSDDADSLPSKVHRESRGTPGKNTRNRI